MYVGMVETKLKEEIWAGKHECPKCCEISDTHLARIVRTGSLFYIIPVLSVTEKRLLVCDKCGEAKKLSKAEYNELRMKQYELLENGEFPSEIIETECNPKYIGLVWRIIKLILSGALSAFYLLCCVMMFVDGIAFSPILCLIIILCTSFPLMLSIKNSIPVWKKKKAYDKLHPKNK